MDRLKRIAPFLKPLLILALFAVALRVLHDTLAQYRYHDVIRYLDALPARSDPPRGRAHPPRLPRDDRLRHAGLPLHPPSAAVPQDRAGVVHRLRVQQQRRACRDWSAARCATGCTTPGG